MQIFDKTTGFLIADPETEYFSTHPDYNSLQKAAEMLILSASGWRKIFAKNGKEESNLEEISVEDYFIAGIAALSYSFFLKKRVSKKKPLILIGMDSRFTGPAVADAMTRVFISQGIEVRSLFIVAAPEIMAYSAVDSDIDGFAYVSASHNPIGHNGLKFGSNGGVYGGAESKELIATFRELLKDKNSIAKIASGLKQLDKNKYISVLEAIPTWKEKAYTEYLNFSKAVIADSDNIKTINNMQQKLKTAAEKRKIGVIAELNGSARTLSIDSEIFNNYGIAVKSINNKARQIVHRIVPEGHSLNDCKSILEQQYKLDKAFILGYVPDNDGDRGNLVYLNEKTGKAEILEAQEVFALSVMSELAFIRDSKKDNSKKLAIAVNGPTSMRIDSIAKTLNVEVFRAEVGEANVVNLAKHLREKGYLVRILGEGSNGGNITYPAAVRDPINTVFSIIKLLLFENLYKLWCKESGQVDKYSSSYGITDILETLPAYTTTSAYEDRAIMKISSSNHITLKNKYESIFITEWNKQKDFLKNKFNIYSYREINYEGENEKDGFGQEFRSGSEKGGLKIIFSDNKGYDTDFIWMRGSGTEPVFRILADCSGKNTERESWLLNWHRSIIEQADKGESI